MGEKDTTEKVLVDYNDVFADIINVLVFNGELQVSESELDNTSVHAQYKAEDGKIHEEERDVTKYWKKENVAIALYGIENQEKPDINMPFRIIGYDGASYRSQLLDDRKNIVPVVTFVLYFGTNRRWSQKRSIRELVNIPKGLESYINDYKIHVFEIAWLAEEQLKMFKSDFGIVANFFVQKRKNKDYVPDDKRVIQHVDAVLKLLSVVTGDNKYEAILYDKEQRGRVSRMCEVAERLVNKGIEQNKHTVIINMLKENEPIDKICRITESDEAYVRRIKAELDV
ncbi:MAG: Rpn family recombination-promoting nuclease/putative transposase [Agathobacter sp.]|nr:Rpn family recombination-promoting nuclease/putative transposase [Agathobacter sp.]